MNRGRSLWVSVALLVWTAATSGCASSATRGKGVVVSVSVPASEAGRDALRAGGNAVDAAVATAFALAVTYPEAGNIGGGGFMLVYPGVGDERKPSVIDYREAAPAASTPTMYAATTKPSSAMLVGVPGTVHGLAVAHRRYGRLPWRDLVEPAVKLAREGFPIEQNVADDLNRVLPKSVDYPEFRRVFAKDPANPSAQWKAGDRIVQPELARTLELIAERGVDGFYVGETAAKVVREVRGEGGIVSLDDLAAYAAVEREPIHGTFRGYDVYAASPPSSGGVALVEMLNVLENFDLRSMGRWDARSLHLVIEAMRRAYCDRACYLGDPAFVETPARLTDKAYAKELAAGIDPDRATPSEELVEGRPIQLAPAEPEHTTHFSVVDADGMAVSNTYTLEETFGGRIVVRGAGFLLNNELGDFNRRPAYTDRKGAIGTPPNEVRPAKRPLSSITPAILAKDGRAVLITGSPGGRTIINTVLQVVLNVAEFGMPPQEAVNAPRMHHAWFPDDVRCEPAMVKDHPGAIEALRRMGHHVVEATGTQGDAHSIWLDPVTGRYVGAADRRLNKRDVSVEE